MKSTEIKTEKPGKKISIKAKKAEQGYCHSCNSPQCGNCAYSKDEYCLLGEFKNTYAGWCPCWTPNESWKINYPEIHSVITKKMVK